MSSSKLDTEAIRRSDAENGVHVFPLSALRPQEEEAATVAFSDRAVEVHRFLLFVMWQAVAHREPRFLARPLPAGLPSPCKPLHFLRGSAYKMQGFVWGHANGLISCMMERKKGGSLHEIVQTASFYV